MSREVESKFFIAAAGRAGGFSVVRRRLRDAGAEFLCEVVQTDRYFDTSDGLLRRGDCGLRIRQVRFLRRGGAEEDARALLTFKGPRRRGASARAIKSRREIQTRVEDGEVLAEILRTLGLRVTAIVRKRRRSYRLGRCRIELDDLPRLGRFVEIEASNEGAIRLACRRLGLAYRPIPSTYLELILGKKEPSRRQLRIGICSAPL